MRTMHVSDPRFDEQYGQPTTPSTERSKWAPCIIGCLAVLVFLMMLAIVVGYWFARNWREVMATGTADMINQGIDSSNLPPEEKKQLKTEVQRVTDAFRKGQISLEQLVKILESLSKSPLMALIIVSSVEIHYLDKSGLSADEKTDAKRTLQRYVRAVADGKIDQQGADAVMIHIADRKPDGRWEMRQTVSDQDLRAALAEAKKRADEVGIPDEPPVFDPSDELKRILDEALPQPALVPEGEED